MSGMTTYEILTSHLPFPCLFKSFVYFFILYEGVLTWETRVLFFEITVRIK